MPSQKPRKGFDRAGAPSTGKAAAGQRPKGAAQGAKTGRNRTLAVVAAVIVVAAIALGGIFLTTRPSSASAGSAATGATSTGTVVQASNGSWTNISADTLAAELKAKDFTLLNVKTPYIGEIDGTDLYIPYNQLAARASELPADKGAKIVVYCRSGNESAIASQTLLDLGYTNIQNLDGGMNAWTASGRSIVQKNRG